MVKKLIFNIKLFFNYLMRGLHSADKMSFGSKGNNIPVDVSVHETIEQHSIWEALLKGEITQEVKELRHQTYYVDKESKKYQYLANGEIIKKNVLHENHVDIDESDNLPIQLIQDNKLITENVYDSLNDIENNNSFKKEYTIEIKRSFIPRFKLEEYTTKLVVKKAGDNKVQLDFYSSIYPEQFKRHHNAYISEMKKIVNGYRQSDIVDIDSVKFITYKAFGSDDSLLYEYNNVKFKSIDIYDGNFVIKFNANIVSDGIDLISKYKDDVMSEKYKNKAQKSNLIVGWTPNMKKNDNEFNVKVANQLKEKLSEQKINNN